MGVGMAVDAVVVGSGPNGLAAAVILARAGLRVELHEAATTLGGGARTAELLLGHRFDVCSAAHPMALAAPFFRAFDLAAHGVRLAVPQVSYAHPLDGGRAGLAWPDLDRTATGLGRDGRAWRDLLGPLVARWPCVVGTAMSDLRRPPAHPLTALRLALRMLPAWRTGFREDVAPALFAGVATHAMRPPSELAATGAGLLLASLGHAVGWPIAIGGSQAITDALVADLRAHGGTVVTGHRVTTLAELPRSRAVLLDVAPRELATIAGTALPDRYARGLRRYRYGSGVCKVDFALSGPVPWAAEGCELAGTLHLVGSREAAIAVEREVRAGRHAERPYVLAVQPGVVDEGRTGTLSTYAHVPAGSTLDVRGAVIAQIERFAPGFRDLIVDMHVITAAEHERGNPNLIGGDIGCGAMTLWQTVLRPIPRWNSYATPIPGVFLCSSATPPGPGVHGMSGLYAARAALRDRFGVRTDPLELVCRSQCRSA
jgi:phytoene dehydrogenase-like protein